MFSEELKLLFTNYSFLLFFSLLIPIYFIVPKKSQWIVLLVASYAFYFCTSSALPVYMVFTTLTVFFSAKKMDKIEQKTLDYINSNKQLTTREERKEIKNKAKSKKKVYLVITVVINLGLLVILKYSNMFISTANGIFNLEISLLDIAVPLGISYYTLQSIGYLIDIYRSKYSCENNIAKFALFVSFFPQIVQGPFGRYDHLAHQLYEEHRFSFERLKSGLTLMLWGYFKKLVLADNISASVEQIFSNVNEYNAVQLIIGTIYYSIQVYADFSGYMDIATGLCEIMGIELAVNFDRPYFAKSVQEFWRRWHITLGAWFKDYVFFPMSVSKVAVNLSKKCRKKGWLNLAKLLPSYIALVFVWSLTGLWHGTDWKYLVWGAGNCIFIIINMQFEPLFEKIKEKLRINKNNFFWNLFRILRTFITVSLLRICSRADSFSQAGAYYARIFTLAGFENFDIKSLILPTLSTQGYDMIPVFLGSGALLLVSLLQSGHPKLRSKLFSKNYFIQSAVLLTLIFIILIFGAYGSDLDLSGFIYGKF